MHCLLLNYYLILLLIISILQANTSRCCLQQERIALLQLKAYYMSLKHSETSMEYLSDELKSWRDEGDDCCTWKRVNCNAGNGDMQNHVTELSLDQLYPYRFMLHDEFYVNVSLFEPFGELVGLNLSYNDLSGVIGHKGNKKSSLRNLEIFDFTGNIVIPHGELAGFVASLVSLKMLFLGDSELQEGFATEALANLKQLQVLDLSHNSMNQFFPSGLCELQSLQELYLWKNFMTGYLPQCIGNLTSLRILDISYNNFNGDLPSTISNLNSLERLSISDNSLTGEFSLNSLLNPSNLKVLILSNNHLHVKFNSSFIHSSNLQLKFIGLSNCNINMQTISFLHFLSHMWNLQLLDISHNGLVGSFPTWLLHNNSNIQVIILRNNSFEGALSLPQHGNQSLLHFDISENNFFGRFPENIGTTMSNLQFLNASRNHFEGKIPTSFRNMTKLKILELSNNNFSSEVPRVMFIHCLSLDYFKLSNNNLRGDVIPTFMNLTRLSVLYLDGNQFTGTIQDNLQKSDLQYMDISNNRVNGQIPIWIANFSSLAVLSMSNNQLNGQIPSELCTIDELMYIDLSNNGLTGMIPSSCYNHPQLLGLQLQNNYLSGSIPNALSRSSKLFTVDLSGNKLSGGIPVSVGHLSKLKILLLGHNSLDGVLPVTLCQLQQISIMDLSSNEITGKIPACLANMAFGTIPTLDDVPYPEGDAYVSTGISSSWYTPTGIDVSLKQLVVTLLTKSRYNDYKGYILNIMSMLDLSCNRLTGTIPGELGRLDKLQALNLSHNELCGSIPSSFYMLKSIESLDLSYNNLSGVIPYQLAQLTYLEIFNVSYNNLSGLVPETGQFASFDESNYKGNQFLCGFVGKSCGLDFNHVSSDREEDDSTDGFDWKVFFWSFGMAFLILFFVSFCGFTYGFSEGIRI